MSVLQTALAFASREHAVFPVNWPIEHAGRLLCSCGSDRRGSPCTSPAKHPYGKLAPHGVLSATVETGIIKHWWGYAAPDANLGVATDRLVVVDADPRHSGDETLAALEHEHAFPLTWRVITGGGGEHVIFKCPTGIEIQSSSANTNPVLGPGIDIRAQGGYIVAVPSRHISGRAYAWNVDYHPADVPLAEAPAWLIERLAAQQTASNGNGVGHDPSLWAKRKAGTITEYRDAAVASVAGKLLRAVSLDPSFVVTLTLAWNAAHCSPPLPAREVEAIVERLMRKEIRRLRPEGPHA